MEEGGCSVVDSGSTDADDEFTDEEKLVTVLDKEIIIYYL